MKKEITIIGAGLVGSLLAIYLSKRGYTVSVYERRADMRKEAMSAGRSINLALSDRGIKALEEVGIMDEIKKIAIPMHGRYLHQPDGSTAFQPYGKEGQFINSVSRAELNKKLMDLAQSHGVKIYFNHKCEHINWSKKEISFETNDQLSLIHYQLLIGADGAYSAARLSHQLQHNRFQYQQYYIDYGYKELVIPATKNNDFAIEKNALHIWPRGNYMLIALPNMDKSFTCTLFFPFEGDPSFASLNTTEKIKSFFETHFADAVNLMPTLTEDFYHNPTSSLVTVKCLPWIRNNHFALIGDAAHAIVPFFGQGMNAGFEDCSVLNALIEKYADDWEKILPEYESLRKPDADAIADLALNNFVEMRDKVADPIFLLQKKIEGKFSAKYPGKWIPAYSMVTFSPHIRYSEALQKGAIQQRIMDEIMALPGIEKNWDSIEIEQLILSKVS
ncbi:MAG TPA: NAD(P)/FAD-dependent oxidoreductase [Ferruginibacter sp.]|nr:FAD-dependent monooxygenase [Bacteroidota bacterium]MCC6693429.1 FAD-dependent monooxygenase [Chitinophagaceae bacterium]HMT96056.1 NAD(P)/FAD-dependent oxidoreductase [Ferruginibacter sp.]HRD42546.1 NAD(P)/FAD-dependent oxidoreductase [Ferruginibacter sp.]